MKNEANFKKENPHFSSETQTKNFFMESKANFFTTPKPHLPALSIAEGSAELFSGILTITKKPYFAKRTQFQQGGLHPNSRNNKGLQQITLQWTTKKRTQSKPNTNPIRTQYEPNPNPIRTQSKPNPNPIRTRLEPKSNPICPYPRIYQFQCFVK